MKISKILTPILGLPLVLGTGLTTMVSCGDKVGDFETDSWSNVVYHANQGLDHLKTAYGLDTFVGLERTINIYGVEHKVRVIGQNEDYLPGEGGNPDTSKPVALTFQFANIVSFIFSDDTTILPVPIHFHNKNENIGWLESHIRSIMQGQDKEYETEAILPELKKQLGDNAIKDVVKWSMVSHEAAQPSLENVFLPSITEIFNVEQIKYWDEYGYFYQEAQLAPGQYREPYSYYRNVIDQEQEDAISHRHEALTLSDAAGFTEPYWLRTSFANDESQYYQTLDISWDGQIYQSNNVSRLSIAPIFCI